MHELGEIIASLLTGTREEEISQALIIGLNYHEARKNMIPNPIDQKNRKLRLKETDLRGLDRWRGMGKSFTCGDEPAVVLHPLVSPPPGLLLLVLLRHLRSLPSDLAGPSERAVHLSCAQRWRTETSEEAETRVHSRGSRGHSSRKARRGRRQAHPWQISS